MLSVGSKVMHPVHGLGTVESIDEQEILGKKHTFASISFQDDRLRIKVNVDQKGSMIRPLIDKEEIDKVLEYLKTDSVALPTRSSERYNINLKKVKSCDIYQLAEVIRDLSAYAASNHRLPPKELQMLKQAKQSMATEFSYITGRDEKLIEEELDSIFHTEALSIIS